MKTAKLIIGIISIVLFVVVIFQSCAVGLGNVISENGESSGSAGVGLAVAMLTAGIVGIATRKGRAGGFVAGGFYLFGGLLGIVNYGSYSDLAVWSVLCLMFGVVFILGSILKKKDNAEEKNENEKDN